MSLRISFIGSRKLSEEQFQKEAKLFYQVAFHCAELGVILRSGGADGADVIAETAYRDAIYASKATNDQVEIFIPWKSFKAKRDLDNPLSHLHIVPSDPVLIKQSEDMVRKTHPTPERLTRGAMKLHSRNMNQVFGLDLQTPIEANICWTENGIKSGGTASAITLCERNNIPVFNLGRPDQDKVLKEIRQFLLDHNVVGVK